jgi:hypothetical protein
MEDSSFDVVGEVTPRINEALGIKVDQAIAFGINRPGEWQNDIITLARQAGNNVSITGSLTYDKLLGEGGLIAKVEESGYMVNGVMAATKTRAGLRGIKDNDGHPIFKTDMQGSTPYSLDGAPMIFPQNGAFDTSVAQMIAGAWDQAVYSIRRDVTVQLLDQAVVQDPSTKEIIYNLAQQGLIAIMVTMRLGWALPNPATRMNGDRTLVPFAYLEPTTPVTDYAVTFTVKDNASTPAAISGARVDVSGAKLNTGTDGTAVFHLRPGTYPATIKKTGYTTQSATITVTNAAVAVAITLPATT